MCIQGTRGWKIVRILVLRRKDNQQLSSYSIWYRFPKMEILLIKILYFILTVDNARHSALTASSLGWPIQGGTAATSLSFLSFKNDSCSLFNSPSIPYIIIKSLLK